MRSTDIMKNDLEFLFHKKCPGDVLPGTADKNISIRKWRREYDCKRNFSGNN